MRKAISAMRGLIMNSAADCRRNAKKQADASGTIVDVFSGAFEAYERGKGNEGEREKRSCCNRVSPAR